MKSKHKKCSYCLGEGFLDIPTYWCDILVDYVMKESDCPQCDGLGSIKNESYEIDIMDFIKK